MRGKQIDPFEPRVISIWNVLNNILHRKQKIVEPLEKSSPKLLDQVADKLRVLHYSKRTERAYVDWICRFILFHQKRHPGEMGGAEIEAFLTHLAVEGKVAVSTQN